MARLFPPWISSLLAHVTCVFDINSIVNNSDDYSDDDFIVKKKIHGNFTMPYSPTEWRVFPVFSCFQHQRMADNVHIIYFFISSARTPMRSELRFNISFVRYCLCFWLYALHLYTHWKSFKASGNSNSNCKQKLNIRSAIVSFDSGCILRTHTHTTHTHTYEYKKQTLSNRQKWHIVPRRKWEIRNENRKKNPF